ncbi:GrpB family protein [Staphylococcus sp. GSSP0090]|nr:GrpB family protein [Staphylococcus sp. GSSP0090]
MHSHIQDLIAEDKDHYFAHQYQTLKKMLFNLLDTPVKTTLHIGGTSHFNYMTEPILDILVGVDNLHDITALDEKRLNYEGFYRLHHAYKKKVIMAQFNNLIDLKQTTRLHIIQKDSSLYRSYIETHHQLTHNQHVANYFGAQKVKLANDVKTIRAYENQKQHLFDTLVDTVS